MKFVILTEGSHKFGLGHIARCTSFYDELIKRRYDVEFVIHGDETVHALLRDRNYSLVDWHGKINELIKSFKHYDGVILDSLNITQEEVSLLCGCDFKLLSIDDFLRNTYNDSIVLDWTINIERSEKHKHNEKNNILLLGAEYAVVRNPFIGNKISKAKTLHRVLITMGGSDIRSLTDPLIESISRSFDDLELLIVTGPGISNKDKVSNVKSNNVKFYSSLDASGMRNVMMDCDIAISAGGQTLYELAALSIPTIAIQVTDNQNEDIVGWKEKGLIYKVFPWDDKSVCEKVCSALYDLKAIGVRQKIKNKINGIIGHNSVAKIMDILIASINVKNRK